MSETKVVLAVAPSSEPTKVQFLRLCRARHIAPERFLAQVRSEMLLVIGKRPSSRKRSRAFCWLTA